METTKHKSKRILLVDDHKIVREGLRALLEKMGNNVIAETELGEEAVTLARMLRPEVIVMDISLPDVNGIEATKRIVGEHDDAKVIALSMYSDKRFVVNMLQAGASGYLLKDCAFEELEDAIEVVSAGGSYVSPTLHDVVVEDYVDKLRRPRRQPSDILTEKELETLVLLAAGRSTKEIALQMNVSPKTIESHRARISEKLDIHTFADLVKYAVREGLTTLDR